MPATWAELRGSLAALLDHFDTPSSTVVDDERVMDATKRWQALAADLPPLPPDDPERTQLLGLLRRLGPALAGLDAPLQQLLQDPSDLLDSTGSQPAPAVLLFDAAMLSFRACQKVGKHAGATAEDLVQLGCCLPLLLGTGRLVAEWAAKAVRLSPSPDQARPLLSDVVANQLDVLATLFDETYRGGVLGSFAADTVPPQALLAWLRAVVAVQQSVPLSCCEQFTRMAIGMDLLSDYLCYIEALQPHREALEADAALCSSLVGTMLRSLGAAAVALRLPPDRRPEGLSWDPAATLGYRLASPTLCPALQQRLQQADRPALLALVQQAAAVLQHLPSAPPDGCSLETLANAHTGSINLLVTVAAQAMERGEPVRRQVVQVLMPTLPQLTTTLQLSAAPGNDEFATVLCGCWKNLLQTMCDAALDAPSTNPIVRQQLAAATDMLRMLPMAAKCAQQLAQPGEGQAAAQTEGWQSVSALGQAILDVMPAFLSRVQPGVRDPQLCAAAREAHEACCRAIHWAAASPDAALLLAPGDGGALKPLLGLLGLAGIAVGNARYGLLAERSLTLRAEMANCAAHWAAVKAAMAAGGASVLQMDHPLKLGTLVKSLISCADYGPWAVRSSTELLTLSDQLLRSLLAGFPENQRGLLETVLSYAQSAPRLATQLIASGTLEVVVSGLRSKHGTDKASQRWLRLAPEFAGVLKTMHLAAGDELGAVDKPPEVVQALGDLLTAARQMRVRDAGVGRMGRAAQIWDALLRALSPAATVAAALQAHWQRADAAPGQQQAAQLELAGAAATRTSCAYLACPNVGATGRRGKLCTACRVARYCCRACSVADWRAGHCTACRLLAAARGPGPAADKAAAE